MPSKEWDFSKQNNKAKSSSTKYSTNTGGGAPDVCVNNALASTEPIYAQIQKISNTGSSPSPPLPPPPPPSIGFSSLPPSPPLPLCRPFSPNSGFRVSFCS